MALQNGLLNSMFKLMNKQSHIQLITVETVFSQLHFTITLRLQPFHIRHYENTHKYTPSSQKYSLFIMNAIYSYLVFSKNLNATKSGYFCKTTGPQKQEWGVYSGYCCPTLFAAQTVTITDPQHGSIHVSIQAPAIHSPSLPSSQTSESDRKQLVTVQESCNCFTNYFKSVEP